jgi:hypothetical protein
MAEDPCAGELQQFQSYLSSISPNYWGKTFKENLEVFGAYTRRLSAHMAGCGAPFQFVSVGSCDGTSDSMIRAFYENKHWNAVFVEASPPNIVYLKDKIKEESSEDRVYVLHAAAMEYCNEPKIEFARPLLTEEQQSMTPDAKKHWMRRQIGRVPKSSDAVKYFKRKSAGWALDSVPCFTAQELFAAWADNSRVPIATPGTSHRAHALKIDVERWSFPVMKGFLSFKFPISELPILLMTELKTSPGDFEEDCREARGLLEARGYAVAPCSQDLLAVLRPEHIL